MNLLEERFGGVIKRGKHEEDGECCILEYRSVKIGIPWTDDPEKVRTFDIRPINDGPWSTNELRTEWMLKLEEAVGGSLDWPEARQRLFVERVIIETVKQIISCLPGLNNQQCLNVTDLKSAKAAAEAAAYAVYTAAYAAYAAHDAEAAKAAAEVAAKAAEAAEAVTKAAKAAEAVTKAAYVAYGAEVAAEAAYAKDKILIKTCQIWIGAANESS